MNVNTCGSDIFVLSKQCLELLLLKDVHNTIVEVGVTSVEVYGRGITEQYNITMKARNVRFPSMKDHMLNDHIFKKIFIESKCGMSLKIQTTARHDSVVRTTTEELLLRPDIRVITSTHDNLHNVEFSQLSFTVCISEEVASMFAARLNSYVHHLKIIFKPTDCEISFKFVDKENTDTDNSDVEDTCAKITNNIILTMWHFHYKKELLEPDTSFKTSKRLPLVYSSYFGTDVKLQLTIKVSTSKTNVDHRLLAFYVYGPYGFPITRDAGNSSGEAISNLVRWEDHGIKIEELSCTNEGAGLLKPYTCAKWSPTRTDETPLRVLFMLTINVVDVADTLKEKFEQTQFVQQNSDRIIKSNLTAVQACLVDALEQIIPQTKLLKRRRTNEISVMNTVSSVFDIITFSTNDLFRDTCMSLVGSATTHGFRDDVYYALSQYTECKLENKKRKHQTADEEDLEWKMLEKFH